MSGKRGEYPDAVGVLSADLAALRGKVDAARRICERPAEMDGEQLAYRVLALLNHGDHAAEVTETSQLRALVAEILDALERSRMFGSRAWIADLPSWRERAEAAAQARGPEPG